MGMLHGGGDGLDQARDGSGVGVGTGGLIGQAAAAAPLHHQVGQRAVAQGGVTHFVNGDDVGMVEAGHGLGLPTKARGRLAPWQTGQGLNGDGALQGRLPGFVDGTHAAVPDLAADLETRNLRQYAHELVRRSTPKGAGEGVVAAVVAAVNQAQRQLGEAGAIFSRDRRLTLAAPGPPLRGDQVQQGLRLVQRGESLQILFQRHGQPAPPAQLNVDVGEFDEEPRPIDGIVDEEILQAWVRAVGLPRFFKGANLRLAARPVLGVGMLHAGGPRLGVRC